MNAEENCIQEKRTLQEKQQKNQIGFKNTFANQIEEVDDDDHADLSASFLDHKQGKRNREQDESSQNFEEQLLNDWNQIQQDIRKKEALQNKQENTKENSQIEQLKLDVIAEESLQDENKLKRNQKQKLPKLKKSKEPKNLKNQSSFSQNIVEASKYYRFKFTYSKQIQKKQEAGFLSARVRALQNYQQKIQKYSQTQKKEIKSINQIKERINSQRKMRQKIQQKRNQETEQLKKGVSRMKESMLRARQTAKAFFCEIKYKQADQQREKRRQNKFMIENIRNKEKESHRNKAEEIRKEMSAIEEKRKINLQERKRLSKTNYQEKVFRSLSAHKSMDKKMRKLRKTQLKFIDQCEKSSLSLEKTLKQLDSIKSEKVTQVIKRSKSKISSFYL